MKRLALTLAIGWTIFAFWILLYPGEKIPYAVGKYDKEGHFLLDFILAFLWTWVFRLTWKWPLWLLILVPVAISAGHAGLSEGLQWLFKSLNRSSDSGDFIAGLKGGCSGTVSYILIYLATRSPRPIKVFVERSLGWT